MTLVLLPGTMAGTGIQRPVRPNSVPPRTYEITIVGRADAVLHAEFDDCQVTVESGTTILRAEVSDQAALWDLMERINGLRLDVIDLHLVASPPAP
jgi:hypothetical protein